MNNELCYGAPTEEDWNKFYRLRALVFEAIQHLLSLDSHCKGYEGCFELTFPNYFASAGRSFEDVGPETFHDGWGLTLHCYLLCWGRRETWTGGSFAECLRKAGPDIMKSVRDALSRSAEDCL